MFTIGIHTRIGYLLMITLIAVQLFAGSPVIKADFDMNGRQESEVTEPGWTPWPVIPDDTVGLTLTKVFDGVTIKMSKYGSAGTALKADWYKAGIQAPNYARLVCDGITVQDGNSGGSIRMTISGLADGTHTLLVYLNAVDGNTYAPIDITANNTKVFTNKSPTNRALTTEAAAMAFFTFTVSGGAPAEILFAPVTSSSSSYKNVIINAFGLNIPDAALQANSPSPQDRDLHINADNGNATLSWKAATSAISHNVYFGTDSAAVVNATTASGALYKGNQTATTYSVTGLKNLNIYWWRIDEVNNKGVVTQGQVWSFSPRHLAFPGAEGHGRFARGGRGGKVVHVTNLNDDGAGSLREAVTKDIGPRTIVFDVSGIIVLKSRLTLSSDFVTIAGQTAPGKGICIRSAPFGFSGVSDGIMRFMRIRLGGGATFDGTGLQGSDYCIFDHNSISWTIDESFSSRSGKNITLQRTMLAEALNIAGHQNYPAGTKHGYAATISGDIGSFHHNLLAHNEGRNWSLGGGLDASGKYAGRLDIFNNVVYNWGGRSTDGGAHEVNFVGNYYKPGPATTMDYALNAQWDGFPGTQQYYCRGNLVKGIFDDTSASKNGCKSESGNPSPWASSPFFESFATLQTAVNAYKDVLSDVGATMPVFDDHDKRMVSETWSGTYKYKGSKSGVAGLIDNEADAGGYESYPALTRESSFDSDKDGLPDWWENTYGTSANSPENDFSDANADPDGDGYTRLEEYLHWMATPQVIADVNQTVQINIAQYSRGYMSTPVWKATSTEAVTLTIKDSTLSITPLKKAGVVYVNFTVTDASGASKVRQIGVYVNGSTGTVMPVKTVEMPRWKVDKRVIRFSTPVPGLFTICNVAGRELSRFTLKEMESRKIELPSGVWLCSFKSERINQTRMVNIVR